MDDLVWSEVTALLSQPERLLALAEEYLGIRETEVEVERDQIDTIDAKLATLREARTQRVTQALKDGVDAAVLKAAVAELEAEERALLAHRARLEEWRDHNQAEKERMRRLRGLADYAEERLGAMTPLERRSVLDLLDVRVAVTGWAECEACGGRGKVKGGTGGLSCPVCYVMRRVPSCRIEGVVLDDLEPGRSGRLSLSARRVAGGRDPLPLAARWLTGILGPLGAWPKSTPSRRRSQIPPGASAGRVGGSGSAWRPRGERRRVAVRRLSGWDACGCPSLRHAARSGSGVPGGGRRCRPRRAARAG